MATVAPATVFPQTVLPTQWTLAGLLIQWLNSFLDEHPLGIVPAPDSALRILPQRMRIPDVSFIRWERFPNRRLPDDLVYGVAPDLAVEILSEGNTPREMELKLDEYRQAGVRLIWYIDPRTRSAAVHSGEGSTETVGEDGVLEGRHVLPGFGVRLPDLLDRYER